MAQLSARLGLFLGDEISGEGLTKMYYNSSFQQKL